MNLSISDSNLFVSVFEVCSQYSSNIKIFISQKGLHIQTTDDANISIIDIKLFYTYFDTYTCIEETTIDFHLKDICKILKICKKSKSVIQIILEKEVFKITITTNNIKKQFILTSIYTNYDLIDINTMEINNIFSIHKDILKSIFEDFIIFTNEISIKIDDTHLKFYCKNDNINMKYDYDSICSNDVINTTNKIKGIFSLDYLHKFKLISYINTNIINVRIDNDKPIFLSAKTRDSEINFILAPKII